jgi:hypothetical protein
MSVEDNRMFPVVIIDEQGAKTDEIVRVFVKRTYPTGETLYEDEEGNLYANSRATQQLGVERIDSEDDLPFAANEDVEPYENPAETPPPATGYEVADEATGAYSKEDEAAAARNADDATDESSKDED